MTTQAVLTGTARGAAAIAASRGPAPRRSILLTSLSGQLGGMELRLADEARVLRELGHDPTLAISPFPGAHAWLEKLRDEGLRTTLFEVLHQLAQQ